VKLVHLVGFITKKSILLLNIMLELEGNALLLISVINISLKIKY